MLTKSNLFLTHNRFWDAFLTILKRFDNAKPHFLRQKSINTVKL